MRQMADGKLLGSSVPDPNQRKNTGTHPKLGACLFLYQTPFVGSAFPFSTASTSLSPT